MKMYASELTPKGNFFVGGTFESRVWSGSQFVAVQNVAVYDPRKNAWLPLQKDAVRGRRRGGGEGREGGRGVEGREGGSKGRGRGGGREGMRDSEEWGRGDGGGRHRKEEEKAGQLMRVCRVGTQFAYPLTCSILCVFCSLTP